MAKIVTDNVLTELVSRLKGGINSKANKNHHHNIMNLGANLLANADFVKGYPYIKIGGDCWVSFYGGSSSSCSYEISTMSSTNYMRVDIKAGCSLEYELGDYHGGNGLEALPYTFSFWATGEPASDMAFTITFEDTDENGAKIETDYMLDASLITADDWNSYAVTHEFNANALYPESRNILITIESPTADSSFGLTWFQLEQNTEATEFNINTEEEVINIAKIAFDEASEHTEVTTTAVYDDFNDFVVDGVYLLKSSALPHKLNNCPPSGLPTSGSYRLEVKECYGNGSELCVQQTLYSTYGIKWTRAKESVWTAWKRETVTDYGLILGDGKNLLAGADFSDISCWTCNNSTASFTNDWLTLTSSGSGSIYTYYNGAETTTLEVGQPYVFSIEYKVDVVSTTTFNFSLRQGTTNKAGNNYGLFGVNGIAITSTDIQKISIPFIATDSTPFVACVGLSGVVVSNYKFYIRNLKIEKGTIATSGPIGEDGDYVTRDELEVELENFAPVSYEDCNVACTNVDEKGIYKTVTYTRVDSGTTYMISTLSNPDTNGRYCTCTWNMYGADGTTLTETKVWTIAYDSNNTITSATLTT